MSYSDTLTLSYIGCGSCVSVNFNIFPQAFSQTDYLLFEYMKCDLVFYCTGGGYTAMPTFGVHRLFVSRRRHTSPKSLAARGGASWRIPFPLPPVGL